MDSMNRRKILLVSARVPLNHLLHKLNSPVPALSRNQLLLCNSLSPGRRGKREGRIERVGVEIVDTNITHLNGSPIIKFQPLKVPLIKTSTIFRMEEEDQLLTFVLFPIVSKSKVLLFQKEKKCHKSRSQGSD